MKRKEVSKYEREGGSDRDSMYQFPKSEIPSFCFSSLAVRIRMDSQHTKVTNELFDSLLVFIIIYISPLVTSWLDSLA